MNKTYHLSVIEIRSFRSCGIQTISPSIPCLISTVYPFRHLRKTTASAAQIHRVANSTDITTLQSARTRHGRLLPADVFLCGSDTYCLSNRTLCRNEKPDRIASVLLNGGTWPSQTQGEDLNTIEANSAVLMPPCWHNPVGSHRT